MIRNRGGNRRIRIGNGGDIVASAALYSAPSAVNKDQGISPK